MNNPVDPQQISPEIQGLLIEAMFWKQKYFELLTHSNQVIAQLSRPSMPPQQIADALRPQSPEQAENVAQNGAQEPVPPC